MSVRWVFSVGPGLPFKVRTTAMSRQTPFPGPWSAVKVSFDECSFTMKGRIEYYGGDLHAADCMYHHTCSVNFHNAYESTSRVYGVGKKLAFQKIVKGEPVLQACANVFILPGRKPRQPSDGCCLVG